MDFDIGRALTAFVTLLVIMDPLGNVPVFLAMLSIGLPALQVAGGIMLFLIALEMFHGHILMPEAAEGVNVAIVPLGVPMLAGPGAIAASMVLMSGQDGQALSWSNQLPVAVGIAATLLVIYLALRYSLFLERLLKDNGIHLVTRVMGMLLLAISVELAASGIQSYIAAA